MASGSHVPSGQLAGHGAGRVEEEVDAHALAPGRGLAVERALGDVDERLDERGRRATVVPDAVPRRGQRGVDDAPAVGGEVGAEVVAAVVAGERA